MRKRYVCIEPINLEEPRSPTTSRTMISDKLKRITARYVPKTSCIVHLTCVSCEPVRPVTAYVDIFPVMVCVHSSRQNPPGSAPPRHIVFVQEVSLRQLVFYYACAYNLRPYLLTYVLAVHSSMVTGTARTRLPLYTLHTLN